MNLIKTFFQYIWLNLDATIIPIVDCSARVFLLGVIGISILFACLNKILSKESGDGK